ncbi:MAG: hypothetical protein MJZ16_00215 [Bacteroidales bacterium]|nr:hypothetical protein [Bacteroidales bacterium]
MIQKEIDNFRSLGPLLLPGLIDLNHLEEINNYDDYAILTFSLSEPMSIEDVMDNMEDQMELNILYHMVTSDSTDSGQHCCAYANPTFGHMYKLNAQTEMSGKVETIYVYVYSSLEIMLEDLKNDLDQHSGFGHFKTKMEMSRFVSDFM